MNKIVVIGLGIVLLIAGGVFIANQQSQSDSSSQTSSVQDDSSAPSGQKNSSGKYLEYTKTTLDAAGGNRRVLFFYANWCPTCRPADESFRQNESSIPDDVRVIRVNYNDSDTDQEEKDVANTYGVTYQHTYVQIDENGNQVTKWNGGKFEELLENIK